MISIIPVIAIIAILITGKKYWNEYQVKKDADQVEKMVHGEEAKTELEHILKLLDRKALTPEGKIKSYQIDDSYTERNPMGGVNISIVVNGDKEMIINTTLERYSSSGKYEINSKAVSPKLSQEIRRGNN